MVYNDSPDAKLAAKMAHELNNPLDAALRFVSLAQRKAKTGDYADIQRYLADAQFGLERMAEVLRELMEIGRQTRTFAVTEHIAQAVRITAAQAEQKQITVHVENMIVSEMPQYDLRLSQILSNLLKNAITASPPAAPVRVLLLPADPKHIAITVEDNGPGLDPAILAQLFTPFATTRAAEKNPLDTGHGLGLAVSRELAEGLGGTLHIENRQPTGCIARLVLPA
jgi:two-component system C4-dicarboxylate transport sensor histidine kinase DctB